MSVVIAVSDTEQDVWMVSNGAFRELAARAGQHLDADQIICESFDRAEMFGGLHLDHLPLDIQVRIAFILIDTARKMAAELEGASDNDRDALFAERLRELVTFLERVYGPRPAAPNGTQAAAQNEELERTHGGYREPPSAV